jgi:hypothetical protein
LLLCSSGTVWSHCDWYKLKSPVFQAYKHEVSTCDLQKQFPYLDGIWYFCLVIWKWICVIAKMPSMFQETLKKSLCYCWITVHPSCWYHEIERWKDQSHVSANEYLCTDSAKGSSNYLSLRRYISCECVFSSS